MPGPNQYDAQADEVRNATHAKGVVLLVFDGSEGNGFSVRTDDPAIAANVPTILRSVAQQLEVGSPPKGAKA